MPVYTYKFTDLLTNREFGNLPLTDVSAQIALSTPGQFSASIDLNDDRLCNTPIEDVIQPQRSAYWVDRDGLLVTGGIIWDDSYDSSSQKHQIVGSTFDSFADHQIIDDALDFENLDLCTIAIQLWNGLQARSNANIGLIVPAEGSVLSGTLDSEQYTADQKATYGSSLQALSQQQPGFDYYVYVDYDQRGMPRKRLILGDPYVGVPTAQSGLVFRRPGNVLDYTWPRAGSQSPNHLYGVGGGTGSVTITSEYLNQARLDAGYPRIEDSIQYKNVFDQDKLDSLTASYGAAVSTGVVTPTITLSPDRPDTPLGSFQVGDPCRIIIDPDPRFPNGLDTYMRITAINLTPASAGQPEKIVCSLASPPE